jgi:ABC-type lipoprotein release transport system permease subunit
LNGSAFSVVGIAHSVLGVQSADLYLSLQALQGVAGQAGSANVLFLRLRRGADVDAAVRTIQSSHPELVITSNRDLANRVSGSVTAAASLATKGTGILASIVFMVAVLVVSLLVWSGVHSRTREIGTLRAIGWSRLLVVRQVTLESLVVSMAGAVMGAVLGIASVDVLGRWLPPLSATLTGGSDEPAQFGLGNLAPAFGSSAALRIDVSPNMDIVMAAVALAIVIGVVAAMIGTTQAARVQPIQAVQRLT